MENAVIVSVKLKSDREKDTSVEELIRLCNTAGGNVEEIFLVKAQAFNPATFMGQGKAEEISLYVQEHDIDCVVFNEEITPAQQNNLEEIIPCKIIDRTRLILDIFALRARTKEGELQVELAQLNYMLPRLTGKGINMMQQKGGIGMRGPGERKLEYDKRRVRQKIAKLEQQIETVKKERAVRRAKRGQIPLPQIAIAGYTNAGKSTLLNALTKTQSTYADDKLFATLDPTTRRVRLTSGITVLFTDTVGFIQKLPHSLVSAFRATLEETKFADIILHVADCADNDMETHSAIVHSVINSLEAGDVPIIEVFNKIDSLPPLKLAALKRRFAGAVFISARTGTGLESLLTKIEDTLSAKWRLHKIHLPNEKIKLLPVIYARTLVCDRQDNEQGITLQIMATNGNYKAVLSRIKEG